jgi:ADP-ribose pyrophosphatase YjhB (NUDIX family)
MQEQLSKIGHELLCATAIIIRDGKILMGYRNYTPDKYKQISVWTTPGGRCNPGEKVEDALRREVLEETDINDLQIIEFLGEVDGAKNGDRVMLFACQTAQEPKLMEPEKFSQWKWIDLATYQSGELGVFNPRSRAIILQYISRL